MNENFDCCARDDWIGRSGFAYLALNFNSGQIAVGDYNDSLRTWTSPAIINDIPLLDDRRLNRDTRYPSGKRIDDGRQKYEEDNYRESPDSIDVELRSR